MFDGNCCQAPDLAIVGFLAPCLRETRIALEIKSVSVATDRDDDLRSIRLPFRAKSRIGQPSAKKCAASARTIRIYAAPLAPPAVRAPCAPRLVDFRDTHDFTAQRTAAARSAGQRFGGSRDSVHSVTTRRRRCSRKPSMRRRMRIGDCRTRRHPVEIDAAEGWDFHSRMPSVEAGHQGEHIDLKALDPADLNSQQPMEAHLDTGPAVGAAE